MVYRSVCSEDQFRFRLFFFFLSGSAPLLCYHTVPSKNIKICTYKLQRKLQCRKIKCDEVKHKKKSKNWVRRTWIFFFVAIAAEIIETKNLFATTYAFLLVRRLTQSWSLSWSPPSSLSWLQLITIKSVTIDFFMQSSVLDILFQKLKLPINAYIKKL